MSPTNADRPVRVVEATIADLADALERGEVTSVELVARCLNRIAAYDRSRIRLNAVPVLNPNAFADAQAADDRRARGGRRGPLDGIPYTAKDSYQAAGLTVAAGSPAFEHLVAGHDAYSIGRLRDAGAVLIGLTNMPPMANGGMQRGVYGRAESPYNADYLTAAFASGSSNGSGTATAASFAVFGLAEETWSSGRAPASNNALVAYTPSRGVISARGNWPLVPTMDVVVPHTRSVDDLLVVLDELVADDPDPRGDFWRVQPWVDVPAASSVRPASYPSLRDPDALAGTRLGVPRMYINGDAESPKPIEARPSVIELWERARRDLEALGAEVVDVDFPVVSNYERDRPGARSMVERGLVPEEFAEREIWDLSIWSWDDFLQANGDPRLHQLADVDGALIFPPPAGGLRDRYDAVIDVDGDDIDLADYVERAKAGVTPLSDIPMIDQGLRGLEETRRVDLEQWMDELGLDAVVFPAVADVGPADADVDPASAELAWRNGTWVANGNLVPRHLGIPTVTVPMGTMTDIGMPVGLTFAGKAYDDSNLLRFGWAFEQSGARRTVPPRTPLLPDEFEGVFAGARSGPAGAFASPVLDVSEIRDGSIVRLSMRVEVSAGSDGCEVALFVNGARVATSHDGSAFVATVDVPAREHAVRHSEWREPYGSLLVAVVRTADGRMSGAFAVSSGPL